MKISECHKTIVVNTKDGDAIICLSKICLINQTKDKLTFYFDANHSFSTTLDSEKECKEALSKILKILNS